jgi:hypothetical protein
MPDVARHSIIIEGAPGAIWPVLTDGMHFRATTGGWLAHSMRWEPGEGLRFLNAASNEIEYQGEVLLCDYRRRLSFTWSDARRPELAAATIDTRLIDLFNFVRVEIDETRPEPLAGRGCRFSRFHARTPAIVLLMASLTKSSASPAPGMTPRRRARRATASKSSRGMRSS